MIHLSKARWAILGAGLLIAVCAGGLFAWRVHTALRDSRNAVHRSATIEFLARPYSPPQRMRFARISAPAEFVRAQIYAGNLYIAGPEGLQEYSPKGTLLRTFAAGLELPGSPLVALTTAVLADSREPELILATASEGLLAYNGKSFRQIYPKEASAREITCVVDGGAGHLLIGTKHRGVLVFDGKTIANLHSTLDAAYVTALAGNEADLWIGTLDRGVLHWHAGMKEGFGELQGMPDPQVMSIALAGEKAYVGTAVGVAVFDRGRFSHVVASGIFARALEVQKKILEIGTEDEGVLRVPLGNRSGDVARGGRSGVSEVRQFFNASGEVYVLTRRALYRMNANGLDWQQVLKANGATLTDSNISALAGDSSGKLWVGYFDRGLDIVAADGGTVRHVEDEHAFCVNRILSDGKTRTVEVATANGLIRFAESGSEEQVLTRADGLIADHVTDVAAYRDGLALATPAGLTFLDGGGARSLYAFHGLVNNHVYALGVAGDELAAGTLGGISMIGHEAVQTNYTASNSGLKHNWITAIVRVDDGWMVGTYGAGVLGLDGSGRFHAFDIATADFDVNPNAMLVTKEHVFAGSLGRGLYVYDRTTGRWTAISDGLPSMNVTALAQAGSSIYVGTDNGLVRIEERDLRP